MSAPFKGWRQNILQLKLSAIGKGLEALDIGFQMDKGPFLSAVSKFRKPEILKLIAAQGEMPTDSRHVNHVKLRIY